MKEFSEYRKAQEEAEKVRKEIAELQKKLNTLQSKEEQKKEYEKDMRKMVESSLVETFEKYFSKYGLKEGYIILRLKDTRDEILSKLTTNDAEGFLTYANYEKILNKVKKVYENDERAKAELAELENQNIDFSEEINTKQPFDLRCFYMEMWKNNTMPFFNNHSMDMLLHCFPMFFLDILEAKKNRFFFVFVYFTIFRLFYQNSLRGLILKLFCASYDNLYISFFLSFIFHSHAYWHYLLINLHNMYIFTHGLHNIFSYHFSLRIFLCAKLPFQNFCRSKIFAVPK